MLSVILLAFLAPPAIGPNDIPPGIEADENTREVLRRINSVGPSETPDLKLIREHVYGRTAIDVEPFGAVKPYKEHFLEQMQYYGPGRSIPEPPPGAVKTVKLGFIGPIMPTVSVATGGASHEEALGKAMLQGARLAIEEANSRGGYLRRGIPFELVVANDNGLWGSTGNEVINMVYRNEVWAMLGTIDSANSHIAIRVALKAETVMMNTGDTDPTFIETNIPWTMRNIGDDRQMGYLLVDYMIRKMKYQRIAIIRASNRYGRFGVREVRDSARRLGKPIVIEMAYKVGGTDFSLQIERVKEMNPDAVVHWGDAREAALILNQMRAAGMKQPYFCSDRAVSREFVELAGANAEGVIAGYPWNPDAPNPRFAEFRKRYAARFKEEPETYASHAYDGMNMLIWATQIAGLNRAKIRDILATRSTPWPGVTGDIPFSAVLDDAGEVFLAQFSNGKWTYHSRESWAIPRGPMPRRDRISRGLESQRAYHDMRGKPLENNVPPRSDIPAGREQAAFVFFGPPDSALGEGVRKAAADASLRLVSVWGTSPWTEGAGALVRAIFNEKPVAIIAGPDPKTVHLAEQIALKLRIPLIDPASTDLTANQAGVPWIFSLATPGIAVDHRLLGASAVNLLSRSLVNISGDPSLLRDELASNFGPNGRIKESSR